MKTFDTICKVLIIFNFVVGAACLCIGQYHAALLDLGGGFLVWWSLGIGKRGAL